MASSSSVNTTNSATHTIPQTNPTTFNFTVPIKLDRQNYLMWKSQVLPSIRGNELEGFINNTKPCPNKFLVVAADDQTAETTVNPEYTLWKKQDQLLLSWLLSSMNESVLSSVISCTTSYEVWNALERLFSSQSKARILQLRMQLQTQKKGSMTVSDFYSKMKNSISDTSLFFMNKDGDTVLLLVYVDDILLTGSNSRIIDDVIQKLNKSFSLKDLGSLKYFLGIEVEMTAEGMHLSQGKYITDLLQRTGMENCKSLPTPMSTSTKLRKEGGKAFSDNTLYRSVIGGLQYATLTRPEITYAVNTLSQYLEAPKQTHWEGCKRILRYLKGTLNYGLHFTPKGKPGLMCFTDADWASDQDDRRSTGGYCTFLGGNLVSWRSKKQKVVARSSTESEYRSLADTSAEITWICSLLGELGMKPKQRPVIWCDNTSAASLASNPVFHARTKHIEIDVHFVREKIANGEQEVRYVPTKEQVADVLTKPLSCDRFRFFRDKLKVSNRQLSLKGGVRKESKSDAT